jgi:hypothetical protein
MANRKKLTLSRHIQFKRVNEKDGTVEFDRSTLLVPGIHNGVKFTKEAIEGMKFEESFPLNLDHSQSVIAEVGFWTGAAIEDGGKLRANPIINKGTEYSKHALGYIDNRQKFGAVPEVSVEIWGHPTTDEEGQDIFESLELDKCSLVSRGAVSPEKGAGIGMAEGEFRYILDSITRPEEITVAIPQADGTLLPVDTFPWSCGDNSTTGWAINGSPIDFTPASELLGVTPKNPPSYGKSRESWKKPTLSDFTSDSWDDLSGSQKREIASHYAWAKANPPETFGDLKLPHHHPKSHNVVWRGVTAAMAALAGARGGVDIPSDDKSAVYSHLAAHYRDFDEKPPSKDDILSADDGSRIYVTEYTIEEDGKEVTKGDQIEASSWEEAQKKADERGRGEQVIGVLVETVSAGEDSEEKGFTVKIDSKDLESLAKSLEEMAESITRQLDDFDERLHAIEEVVSKDVESKVEESTEDEPQKAEKHHEEKPEKPEEEKEEPKKAVRKTVMGADAEENDDDNTFQDFLKGKFGNKTLAEVFADKGR